jgi:hypothetical protein
MSTPPSERRPLPRPRLRRPAGAARVRPPNSTLAFHASRVVIDLGVLLVLASMSLTYVTAASGNRSALDLDALPVLILVAPIFVVTLIPDHTRPLPRQVAWAALVVGLAAFPYAVVKYLDATVLADTLGGSLGLGARLLVFGDFVVLVGITIGLTRAWMGLASGGSPTRIAAKPLRAEAESPAEPRPAPTGAPRPAPPPPRSKPRPARVSGEVSPFGEPLFDSLEVPATAPAPPPRQPDLVVGAEGSERSADQPDDPDQTDPG